MERLVLSDAGHYPIALMGAVEVICAKTKNLHTFVGCGTSSLIAALLALEIPIKTIVEECESSILITQIVCDRDHRSLFATLFRPSRQEELIKQFRYWLEKILKSHDYNIDIVFHELENELILTVENVETNAIYTLCKERTPNMKIIDAVCRCFMKYSDNSEPSTIDFLVDRDPSTNDDDDYFSTEKKWKRVDINASGFLLSYPLTVVEEKNTIGIQIVVRQEIFHVNTEFNRQSCDLIELWRRKNFMPRYNPNTIYVNITNYYTNSQIDSSTFREILMKSRQAALIYFEN